LKRWLLETKETYIGNATAQRDFRTQLRGIKPILLWTSYLLLLIFSGMAVYGNLEGSGTRSLASLQWSLKGFYGTVLMILSGAVVVVTPALTAASIASERQRRSLDLILSTPLQIKSYLVGKLIASYRYTWMLLILSLPLVSMCIILGGATWGEVLVVYVRLSLFGILFTAIGLLMSVLAPKPVSAIVYAYIAVGFYIFLSTALAAFVETGSTSMSIPLVASFSPFLDGVLATRSGFAYDTLLAAWLPLVVLVAFASKILLLGAASAMSGYRSPYTINLRIHIVFAVAAIVALLCIALPDSIMFGLTSSLLGTHSSGSYGSTPGFTHALGRYTGLFLCAGAIFFHWAIPFIACFSPVAEKRFQPNGIFKLRETFSGTPAGALPYLLLIVSAATAAAIATYRVMGVPVSIEQIAHAFTWTVGSIAFVWSICVLASTFSKSLTTARGSSLVLLVCVFLLPTPVLQALAEIDGNGTIWMLHPYSSVFGAGLERSYMGYAMILCATAISLTAYLNLRRNPATFEARTS
jgi:hypothetical protein